MGETGRRHRTVDGIILSLKTRKIKLSRAKDAMTLSPFRGDRFKTEVYVIWSMIISLGVIPLFLAYVIIPHWQKKQDQLNSDAESVASYVAKYEEREGQLPDTMRELREFVLENTPDSNEALPIEDPWGQAYLYAVASDGILFLSSGRNKKIDTTLIDFRTKHDIKTFHKLRNLYLVAGTGEDDWVFLIKRSLK
jgi:hypothetical protein